MYQLRFGFGEEELVRIYENKKISKHFQAMKNETFFHLACQVSLICEEIRKESKSDLLSYLNIQKSDIIANFYKNVRQKVLIEAIYMSIDGKFNIKNNIIEILDGDYVLKCIEGDFLSYSIFSLMRDATIDVDDMENVIEKIESLEIFEEF